MRPLAGRGVKPRVVGQRCDPLVPKNGRQFIDVAAANAVNDAGFARMATNQIARLTQRVVPRQNAIGQVRPVEIAYQHLGIA